MKNVFKDSKTAQNQFATFADQNFISVTSQKEYLTNIDTFRDVQKQSLDLLNPLQEIESNNYFSSQTQNQKNLKINIQNSDYQSTPKQSNFNFIGQVSSKNPNPQNKNCPVSPNCFHNPITSGLNSAQLASPMLNNTANFPGFKLGGAGGTNSTTSVYQSLDGSLESNPASNRYGEPSKNETTYREKLENLKAAQMKIQENLKFIQQELDGKGKDQLTDEITQHKRISSQALLMTQDNIYSKNGQFEDTIKIIQPRSKEKAQFSISNPASSSQGPSSQLSPDRGMSQSKESLKFEMSSSQKSGFKSSKTSDEKLYNDFKDRQAKLQKMQQCKQQEELSLLKNKPTISPNSKRLAAGQGKTFYQKQEELLESRQRAIEEWQRQELQKEQSSFRPLINEQSSSLSRGVRDLMTWEKKREAKQVVARQEWEEQEDRQGLRERKGMCEGSKRIVEEQKSGQKLPFHERQYQQLQRSERKKEILKKALERSKEGQGSPKINEKSRKIVEEKRAAQKRAIPVYERKANNSQPHHEPVKLEPSFIPSQHQQQYSQTSSLPLQPSTLKSRHSSSTSLHQPAENFNVYTSLFDKVASQSNTIPKGSNLLSQHSQSSVGADFGMNDRSKRILDMILDSEEQPKRTSALVSLKSSGMASTFGRNGTKPMTMTSLLGTEQKHGQKGSMLQQTEKLKENWQMSSLGRMRANQFQSTQSNSVEKNDYILEEQEVCPSSRMRFKDLGVLQRNQVWLNNRNRKIASARETTKDKDLDGCTFEPRLCKYKPPRHELRQSSQGKGGHRAKSVEKKREQSVNKRGYVNQQKSNKKGDSSYTQMFERKRSLRSRSSDHNSSSLTASLQNQSRNSGCRATITDYSQQKQQLSKSQTNQKNQQSMPNLLYSQMLGEQELLGSSGFQMESEQSNQKTDRFNNYSTYQQMVEQINFQECAQQQQDGIPNKVIKLGDFNLTQPQLEPICEEQSAQVSPEQQNKGADARRKKKQSSYVPLSQRIATYASQYQQQQQPRNDHFEFQEQQNTILQNNPSQIHNETGSSSSLALNVPKDCTNLRPISLYQNSTIQLQRRVADEMMHDNGQSIFENWESSSSSNAELYREKLERAKATLARIKGAKNA